MVIAFCPDAVVIVATVRALKMHGGVPKTELKTPNVEAVKAGLCNLEKHIENVKKFGVPAVVAINIFAQDTAEELEAVREHCAKHGVLKVARAALSWLKRLWLWLKAARLISSPSMSWICP